MVGNISLDPEDKLSLLLKYERLALDPQELRSANPFLDCDPSKLSEYLELMPFWFRLYDKNKNRLIIER